MESCHGPRCTSKLSSKPAVAAIRRSVGSFDGAYLTLDGLVGSLHASVGVAVADWALFVDNFGWVVCACFVFDVDDAGTLIVLQDHFLTTGGQHVGCECSFCVPVTRVLAKYCVGEACFPHSVVSSQDCDRGSITTHEGGFCGEPRHAAAQLALATHAGVWCIETAAWQHCIDYTASAGLSKLGAPAAQVSGGQIPPSANKKKRPLVKLRSLQHIMSHLPAVPRPPSI